ncbi:Por secretion system C-terminal sorting domain-containing protein [Flaviramulus basaltis]|uniref:Por secretion system C-terminal sorting domain-containing protein n=1 Tax=Flaviramulus basaltis TaxID=369401 RepID=A0A1K2IDP3_9FLAO|nr:zinc-dependent metalloprotease family protein [Flaviramulus basaltis]SFZ90513.1 Por secretion system C-terminal sorting domain-containing protein [Flaviramulus basaltis]
MKQTYLKYIILFLTLLLFSLGLSAQNQKLLWTKTTQQKATKSKQLQRKSQPYKKDFYQLDLEALKVSLRNAPVRGKTSQLSNILIDFPLANGSFETFRIIEAPILHPDLQASMPNSRTYVGQSTTNPVNRIRFSITSRGLNTMLQSSEGGMQFIDPTSFGGNNYMVYKKKDLPALKEGFICNVIDEIPLKKTSNFKTQMQKNANDGILRTFRLAIASTIEYSEFHWMAAGLSAIDTEADKKNAVMDAMIITMNRVNGIFENELSISMEFVANNKDVIFIDSDSFTNDDADFLIDESQTVIDNIIGNSNYDIGHTFSTGGGGVAELNSPCNSGSKARGITGSSSPVGDSYDIDFVAHEMGHQFGSPHTFNGNTGNCVGTNRNASSAYEPGSGTTIMAYAGICSPQNVQTQSDAYFHQKSLQMIWDNITTGFSICGAQSFTNNSAPTAEAGASYTIPISTPYKLTGSSTDLNGTSTHTYTWEQYNLGNAGLPKEDDISEGPLVRSFEGTDNATRYIPRLQDLAINGGSTTWEKLASISRNINFQLTVRDNDSRGGQTATDNMVATTTTAAGPFLVTSQSTTGISWPQGSSQTITWDVAGTTGNGVNTANVNILLSTDRGLNYDTILASSVPNDGSQDITVPNIMAGFCRIMVEGDGNIFFAINTEDIAIGYTVTESCTEYTSTDSNLPLDILDNGSDFTTVSGVNVPASVIISDVKLTVDITHPYPGDILLGLQSPTGTLVNILEPSICTNEDANIVVTFDDNGSSFDCNLTGNGFTMQSPISLLSSWNDENASGNWLLGVGDFEEEDAGTLNSWSITICGVVLTPLSINTYEFNDFQVYPNPNKGEFTIKLSSSLSSDVSVKVYDLRGRIIYKYIYDNTGSFNEKINLSNVQSGMYILNVSDGLRKSSKKIIVE